MIIILNEDPVYLSWLRRHRQGFVLETRHKPTKRNTVLHRATCTEICSSPGKRPHFTTGGKMKACCTDIGELVAWTIAQAGGEPRDCERCAPRTEPGTDEHVLPFQMPADDHLTRLGQDIVSCVVEVAVIHLDDHTPYQLTMGYLANYVGKSPAQLTAAVIRLVHQGHLAIDAKPKPGESIPTDCRIFPTSQALRELPAFDALDEQELAAELKGLYEN